MAGHRLNPLQLSDRVIGFIEKCRLAPHHWAFASTPGGPETLYASCFAVMLLHYLGRLDRLPPEQKSAWAEYLNRWQKPGSGYFIGPELVPNELHSRKHSYEHIASHLTAHVLPALSLLNVRPRHPLRFARPFLDLDHLTTWLGARDWRDAWLEGNNLLFVGQFLIHLREEEGLDQAQAALDLYFDWLDQEVDPATGLWGSNGYCPPAAALYGGYHQLLVYYYEGRPVPFPERLVDVALSLQHADGGFHPRGGGGACEDTDAIDILVNMYKQTNYKHPQIRAALRRAFSHILQRQMPDGGFVYRLDQSFIHMGIEKTVSPPNQSNLFPTWFRVHTLALIGEILTDEPVAGMDWGFNDRCSMGWHRPWEKRRHALGWWHREQEQLAPQWDRLKQKGRRLPQRARRLGGRIKRRLLGGVLNG